MPSRNLLVGTVTVFWSLALTGCGAKKEPVPVKGKVEYVGGRPVANMVLIFHPLDHARKPSRHRGFGADRQVMSAPAEDQIGSQGASIRG